MPVRCADRGTDQLFLDYRRTRDRDLRNQLVERHAALAVRIARDFAHRGVERDDLQQVALLALVKAVDRFDPSRGSPFVAFASATINGEIKRYFRDHTWGVRPPRRVQEAHLAVRRATDELTSSLGRIPTVSEVATHLGERDDTILQAMVAGTAYQSESIEPADTDGTPMEGRLSCTEPGFDRIDDQQAVHRLLLHLAPRDRRIVELRYWGDATQAEIAEQVGVSQMHVSRLLRRIADHLRAVSEPVTVDA